MVKCADDPTDQGSHGFCLINNVAVAASYARHVYRHRGVRRVAIVDFDVHHGRPAGVLVFGRLFFVCVAVACVSAGGWLRRVAVLLVGPGDGWDRR